MNRYSSIFATEDHEKITSLAQMKQLNGKPRHHGYGSMGLFLNKTCIGHGWLYLYEKHPNSVNTSGTKIFDEFRKQGHGIRLYLRLISTAKKLGAKRIYSDDCLNKLSEKMWSKKLPKHFPVFKVFTGSATYCPCCKKKHKTLYRYFIELGK